MALLDFSAPGSTVVQGMQQLQLGRVLAVFAIFVQLSSGLLGFFPGGAGTKKGSMEVVAVTGATGLVGTQLVKSLEAKGATVRRITTGAVPTNSPSNYYKWDPTAGALDSSAFAGCDAVVHLAGENIASGSFEPFETPFSLIGAWTKAKKEKIAGSRVDGTRLVVDTINQTPAASRPKVLVCASAVGFYGFDNNQRVYTEEFRQGGGFLAQVVRDWESEALKASCRTVCARFGVVLSTKGGVVGKLAPLFKLAAGGNLGSGEQGFSWVSVDDAVAAIEFALEKNSVTGPINVVAPQPSTNADFTRALGAAVQRPAIVPVPQFVGDVVFGEMGREVLFGGQKAAPAKLTAAGFKFSDVDLGATLKRLLSA